MFARINQCLKRYNCRLWSPVAQWKYVSTVKPQDQPSIDMNDVKTKESCDYIMSQDAQVNIKDLNGENITPIDVNPWNQDLNAAEQNNEPTQGQEKEQTQAPAAEV